MALRANYQGIKKVRAPLSLTTEGTLIADMTVIAPTEPGATSEHAYNIGDELYLSDGTLYVVTSPIAVDDTFIIKPNENYNLEPAGSIVSQIRDIKEDIVDLDETKADITSIGTDEAGTTASKAYAVGEHFYKDGKFCTVISSIAEGATFTKGTNYVEGDIADNLTTHDITITPAQGGTLSNDTRCFRYGNMGVLIVSEEIASLPAETAVSIGSISTAYKPDKSTIEAIVDCASGKPILLQVNRSNGGISLYAYEALTNVKIRAIYTWIIGK